MGKDFEHPATNGATKKMVFMSIVFIFILSLSALIMAFTVNFHLSGITLWLAKGLFGTIATTGLGALVAITRKFFDTRTEAIKARDKLEAKKERHKYKLDKMKLKKEK